MAKLERKLTKIFAETSGSQGTAVYGSKKMGNVQYSKDIEVLQNNKYQIGRSEGVTNKKAPVLQEENTIDYVLSHQIKYINQMGVCEWYDKETYYVGSIVNVGGTLYVSLQNDNINHNPLIDTQYWKLFTGSDTNSVGYNLFDRVFKDHLLTYEEKFGLELLGEYVYKTAVAGTRYGYPDFYNKVLAEYNDPNNTDDTTTIAGITIKVNQNGHKFYDIADKSAVDTVYNNTGIAWFYGVDTTNERIFLPRNDYCFINQKNHIGNDIGVGNYFEGELPQHTHSVRTTTTYDNISPNGTVGGGNLGNNITAYTNSVYNNPIYKDNGQVKPTGVGVYVYMCVGNVAQEEAQGQYIDFTTTENDTIPLFTAEIFEFDAGQENPSWLRANGNYVSGLVYPTCYAKLVSLLNYNPLKLKVIDYGSLDPNTDYSEYWIVNQTNQTFRCPISYNNQTIAQIEATGKYLFFKVANAVENLEIINGAGVLSALNNKLDLTENMIPSSKYDDLTLGASGTTYVAPANGWFYCRKTANGNNQYLNIYNNSKCDMSIESRATASGADAATIIPVAKNDIVSVKYTVGGATQRFVFIYSTNN